MNGANRQIGVWALVALLTAASAACARVVLVAKGQPEASIVISADATDVEKDAAQLLQSYVQRISGATLPIVADTEPINGAVISVGLTQRVDDAVRARLRIGEPVLLSDSMDDAYLVRAADNVILLVGHRDQATRFAVYDLLHTLGCRWYFASDAGEIVPRLNSIAIDDQDRLEAPSFSVRYQYAWHGRTAQTIKRELEWRRANRLDDADAPGFSGHNFAAIWPPKVYFDEHPDIYPLIKGKRERPTGGVDWQPCLANPKTIAIAIDWVRKTLTEHPEYQIVTLAPNDGFGYCECDRCAALGNRADQHLHLANQVLRAVGDEFPNVLVNIWAYADSAVPPTTRADGYESGRDRVLVSLYSVYSKTPFDQLLQGWQEASHHLMASHAWYFFSYRWPLAFTPRRYPEVLAEYPKLRDCGVRLLRLQAQGDWGRVGLDRYLSAGLMWDADADPEALTREFCRSMFPNATLEFYNFIALFDGVNRNEVDPETFARHGLYWLDRLRRAPLTEDERQRWTFYALYLHAIPLELRFESAVGNAAKIDSLKEVAAYLKGVEPLGIFESTARVRMQCYDKMKKLYGYEGSDRDLREIEPLAVDPATVDRLFEQDRRDFPPLSPVPLREPLDWKDP